MSFKIGFINNPFPLVEGSKTETKVYNTECLGRPVRVEVSKCKFRLNDGDYKHVEFSGIITNSIYIRKLFPLGDFGQSAYLDEGHTLLEVANAYAEDKGLVINDVLCNWPIFRAIAFVMPDENK